MVQQCGTTGPQGLRTPANKRCDEKRMPKRAKSRGFGKRSLRADVIGERTERWEAQAKRAPSRIHRRVKRADKRAREQSERRAELKSERSGQTDGLASEASARRRSGAKRGVVRALAAAVASSFFVDAVVGLGPYPLSQGHQPIYSLGSRQCHVLRCEIMRYDRT